MATSADKDDEKSTATEDGEAATTDDGEAAKPTSDDADSSDAEASEKPASAPSAKPAASKAKPSGAAKRGTPAGKVTRPRAAPPPARKGGSLGKSMLLFAVIVGGLAAAFALLGNEAGTTAAPNAPKWKKGDTAEVEITTVASDAKDLSCALADEVEGKHCAFEAQAKPWTKSDNADDKKLLKPYTTTDRIQFLAAGLWSDPVMAADKLPKTRFSVKCKLTVDGKATKASVRWSTDSQWYDRGNDLYVGTLSSCKIVP